MESSTQGEDLTVVVRARALAGYLFTVTEKSPKRFRFTLTARMQNACLDILESLYMANDTWIDVRDAPPGVVRERLRERRDHQHRVLSAARRLDCLLTLSREHGALLAKQQAFASELLGEVIALTRGWIKSDGKRFPVKEE